MNSQSQDSSRGDDDMSMSVSISMSMDTISVPTPATTARRPVHVQYPPPILLPDDSSTILDDDTDDPTLTLTRDSKVTSHTLNNYSNNNNNNVNVKFLSFHTPEQVTVPATSSSPLLPHHTTTANTLMMNVHQPWDVEKARTELRRAIPILSKYGLKLASKWASEQLIGLQLPMTTTTTTTTTIDETSSIHNKPHKFEFSTHTPTPTSRKVENSNTVVGVNDYYYHYYEMTSSLSDVEIHAKSIFDIGEYQSAASILSASSSTITTTTYLSSSSSNGSSQPTRMNGTNQNVSGGKGYNSIHVSSTSSSSSSFGPNNNKGGDLMFNPPLENLSSFGIFLRAYCLYMAGERRKEEEVLELRDSLERTTTRNANLPQLISELHDYYKRKKLDAFGLYIYGVTLKERQKSPTYIQHNFHPSRTNPSSSTRNNNPKRNDDGNNSPSNISAQSILMESILQFPHNWSAWLDLAELCTNDPGIQDQVENYLKPMSTHWMYHFFCVHVFLENQANENAIAIIDRLIQGPTTTTTTTTNNLHRNEQVAISEEACSGTNNGFFVQSPYLLSQLAVAHYNIRDFDTAQTYFASLAERYPLRLDQMDVYSNILYVKEDKVTLSQLAHKAIKIDKYRPETCCIVGNYYSLKSQHEKAVQYFQRALKLDRTYLSAWTLMGHEYLEMKNTAAAIEAYRRAVDINPRDYRAWYGLGQTYEIMNMLLYALYYYRKAVGLRPYDARMWCAMGGCYMGLERRSDAIRSYERAMANNDSEGIATRKLATLYREDKNVEQAARCYLRHLELRFQAQQPHGAPSIVDGNAIEAVITSVNVDEPEAEALLFLAYYHRDHEDFDMASICCSRLLDYPGPEKEEGKALLREIRSRLDQKEKMWEGMHGGRKGKKQYDSNASDSFEFSP